MLFWKKSEEYYFKIDTHSLGITHRNVFWFIVKEDKRLGALKKKKSP